VVKSKVLERTDNSEKVTLLMMQKAFGVTAAVETDDEIHIMKLDASRVYSLSVSTHVQEIVDYGRPGGHLLSEDRGPGYDWLHDNGCRAVSYTHLTLPTICSV